VLGFTFTQAARGQLELQIDEDLNVSIVNTSEGAIQIKGYQIVSGSGLLAPGGWNSITRQIDSNPPDSVLEIIDQFTAGALTFGEARSDAGTLAELNFNGEAVFAPDFSFAIGQPFVGTSEEVLDDHPRLSYLELIDGKLEVVDTCLGLDQCEPIPPRLPGDTNRDGQITLGDFSSLKSNFGSLFERGDQNSDGQTDLFDFASLIKQFTDDPDSVGLADLGILRSNFGLPPSYTFGDVDTNGRVGLEDFALMKATFGSSAPLQANVPEPSTLFLALLGAIAFGLFARQYPSQGN